MGFSITYVIARWNRPLAELTANTALVNGSDPDPQYSWDRADGWQCFAPEGFYDGRLVPPVVRIQTEVGGPVLGMGVESSSHWRAAFHLDGELRWIAAGPSEDGASEEYEAEMIARWGPDWQAGAAAGLAAWAAPWAHVDAGAIEAVLRVPHLFPENKLADLQRMLTLVPAAEHRWWESWNYGAIHEDEVPHASYAVNATQVNIVGLMPPADRYINRTGEIALALTDSGYGLWDRDTSGWVHDPTLPLDDALTMLTHVLPARRWRPS